MSESETHPMGDIKIYWDDLTVEKQREILKVFGDNCNFDISPLITLSPDAPEMELHQQM